MPTRRVAKSWNVWFLIGGMLICSMFLLLLQKVYSPYGITQIQPEISTEAKTRDTLFALGRTESARHRSPNFGYFEAGPDIYSDFEKHAPKRLVVEWATTTQRESVDLLTRLDAFKALGRIEQEAFLDYATGTLLTYVGTVRGLTPVEQADAPTNYKGWSVFTLQVIASRGYSYEDVAYDVLVSPQGDRAVMLVPVVSYRHKAFEKDGLLSKKEILDPWGVVPMEKGYELLYSIADHYERLNDGEYFDWVSGRSLDLLRHQSLEMRQRFPACNPTVSCEDIVRAGYNVATTTREGRIVYEDSEKRSDETNMYYLLLEDRYLVQVTGGDVSLADLTLSEATPKHSVTYVPSGLCFGWGKMSAATTAAFVQREGARLEVAPFRSQTVLTFRDAGSLRDLRTIPGINYEIGMGSVSFAPDSIAQPVFFARNLLGLWTLYIDRSACGG